MHIAGIPSLFGNTKFRSFKGVKRVFFKDIFKSLIFHTPTNLTNYTKRYIQGLNTFIIYIHYIKI